MNNIENELERLSNSNDNGIIIVEITDPESAHTNISANFSVSQIFEFIDQGKIVVCKYNNHFFYLRSYGSTIVYFQQVDFDEVNTLVGQLSDNSWTVYFGESPY